MIDQSNMIDQKRNIEEQIEDIIQVEINCTNWFTTRFNIKIVMQNNVKRHYE